MSVDVPNRLPLFFSPRGESVRSAIAAKQLVLRQPVVLINGDEQLFASFQQLIRPDTLVVGLNCEER